jgi:hypothetical protein
MPDTAIRINAILELLKYVVPLFILWGVMKLNIYYGEFQIAILAYLDFGEILTSFFGDVLIFTATVVPTAIMLSMMLKHGDLDFTPGTVIPLKQRLIWYLRRSHYIVIVHAVAWGIFWLIDSDNSTLLFLGFIASNLAFVVTQELASSYRDTPDQKLVLFLCLLLFMTLLLTIVFALTAMSEARVMKKRPQKGFVVHNERDTIVLNSTTLLIGKTSGYIFIYRKKERQTQIIPVAEVKEISHFEMQNGASQPSKRNQDTIKKVPTIPSEGRRKKDSTLPVLDRR